MNRYVFKRAFRNKVIIEANCTLTLRKECRKIIGYRKSARLIYRQIGSNSFIIENCLGFKIADVYIVQCNIK